MQKVRLSSKEQQAVSGGYICLVEEREGNEKYYTYAILLDKPKKVSKEDGTTQYVFTILGTAGATEEYLARSLAYTDVDGFSQKFKGISKKIYKIPAGLQILQRTDYTLTIG